MSNFRPKVIDLFAGVGGLSLGAARAGFDVALAVENDPHALAAHARNFPETRHLSCDVGGLTGKSILSNVDLDGQALDGMIGGPPCQGFSVMGRQAVADPRNDLFGKFFELVSECLPKFFVAENVSNIMTPKYESIRDAAFSHVEARYTLLPPMRIKASDYGGATVRERVFFIGFLRDEIKPATSEEFQARRKPGVTVKRALAGLPTDIDDQWLTEVQSWQRLGEIEPCDYIKNAVQSLVEGVGASEAISRLSGKREVSGCFGTRHSEPVRQRYGDLRPKQKDDISKAVRLDWEGFCPTLRAGTAADKGSYQAVRPIHPSQARVITPREAARLQGFPDWFQFAPSKWHSFRQIGNSVCPLVGEAVFQVIAKRL